MNTYEVTYYMNTARRERRPTTKQDLQDDLKVKVIECDPNKLFIIIARDLLGREFKSEVDAEHDIKYADWGDGFPYVISIRNIKTDYYILGDEYAADEFIKGEPYVDFDIEDAVRLAFNDCDFKLDFDKFVDLMSAWHRNEDFDPAEFSDVHEAADYIRRSVYDMCDAVSDEDKKFIYSIVGAPYSFSD